MKNMYGKSVLVGAIIGILAVGVSFAAFASTLTITGTATTTGDFDVKFTNATATDTGATTTITPLGTTMSPDGVLTFQIATELAQPGSKSVVEYTITNLGSIEATVGAPSVVCKQQSSSGTTTACNEDDITVEVNGTQTDLSNNGTIDATLENLVITSNQDSDVSFNTNDISGDLLSGNTINGTITVTWNADSYSAQKDVSFNAYIKATQKK